MGGPLGWIADSILYGMIDVSLSHSTHLISPDLMSVYDSVPDGADGSGRVPAQQPVDGLPGQPVLPRDDHPGSLHQHSLHTLRV